jgi:uridine phosphorylase
MEAATVLTLGRRLGVATACALLVTDTFDDGGRRRIEDDELADAVERLGALAAAALKPQ